MILCCALVTLLVTLSAAASTIYVDACATGGGVYRTLTGAVAAASAGDTIVLQAGSYPETMLIGKKLLLNAVDGPALVGEHDVGWKDVIVSGHKARVYYPSTTPGGAQIACGGPFPAVVYAHGRRGTEAPCEGWSNPDRSQDYLQAEGILARLAASGIIALSVDHSGDFHLADKTQTVIDAITYLRDQNQASGSWLEGAVRLDRVGLSGHSTGGAAVIEAVASSPVPIRSLGLIAPSCSNLGWPSEACRRGAPPGVHTLVIHGTNEYRCQVGNAPLTLYCDAIRPKHLVVVEGANHFGYTDGICITDDNDSTVGGVEGAEARARQQRAAGNYLRTFFAYYMQGNADALTYLVQDGGQGQICPVAPEFGQPCSDPVKRPTCAGTPQRTFKDLESLKVAVQVCSSLP